MNRKEKGEKQSEESGRNEALFLRCLPVGFTAPSV